MFTITIFLNKIGREISIPLTSMRDKSDWVVSSSPSLVSEGFYFIKKGKTTEELEKFTNPKRDYLKNLLEMDSQHSRKSSEIQDR